jgi:hypothetical protein
MKAVPETVEVVGAPKPLPSGEDITKYQTTSKEVLECTKPRKGYSLV